MFLNRYTVPSLNARDVLLSPFTTRISVTIFDALKHIKDGSELVAGLTIIVINANNSRD